MELCVWIVLTPFQHNIHIAPHEHFLPPSGLSCGRRNIQNRNNARTTQYWFLEMSKTISESDINNFCVHLCDIVWRYLNAEYPINRKIF
jgi:hypothetical protein